ncbi:MAG: hypothetical protein IT562_04090 [Alphaproteobacteria bacterium]|nr:hypothetical protein [Alphaproteobacteria bacterium]
MPSSIALYKKIFDTFQAPVSRYDCGRKCAPLNEGVPVCCDTGHAIPLVDKHEWLLLKSRSDLWRPYRARDAQAKEELADKHRDCRAIECKGFRHCERDNRSMACRAFPFFPYITREDELVGLSVFWDFADRCWVQSNLQIVEPAFVRECIAAYELLFDNDKLERDANREHSAAMRRAFTRMDRIIPLLGRKGEYLAIEPRTHKIRRAHWREYVRNDTFKDEKPAAPAPR